MPITVVTTNRYASSYLGSGRVRVEGFDVQFVAPTPNTTVVFNDFLHKLAHDAVDLPLSNYLIARDLGKPLMAIPAFPTMFNPLLGAMVNRKAGIRSVDDLVGKRVGVSGFAFNPAVWLRSMFVHQYDVSIERMIWVEGEPNSMSGVPFGRSRRFSTEQSENLMDRLVQGQIDALIMSDGGVEPTEHIDRLFPDYWAEIDRYVRQTAVFPVNSVVTFRQDVLRANPGLDRALTEAYQKAWRLYVQEATDDSRHMELSVGELRSRGLFPLEQGFPARREAIRIMIHACYEQGLIRNLVDPEELFALTD